MRAAAVLAAAVLIAGCGDAEPQTARQVYDAMLTELAKVRSYRIDTVSSDGKTASRSSILVARSGDFRFAGDGTVVVSTGGRVYVRFPGKAWSVMSEQASAAYLQDLGRGLDLRHLASCARRQTGTVSFGRSRSYAGRRVRVLVTRADKPGAIAAQYLVAATGRALPLREVTTGHARPGAPSDCPSDEKETAATVTWSRIDEDIVIAAPAHAEPLPDEANPLS